jgi:hypothetical protein
MLHKRVDLEEAHSDYDRLANCRTVHDDVAAFVQAQKQLVNAVEIPAMTIGIALGHQQVFFHAEHRKHAATLRHQAHTAAHGNASSGWIS